MLLKMCYRLKDCVSRMGRRDKLQKMCCRLRDCMSRGDRKCTMADHQRCKSLMDRNCTMVNIHNSADSDLQNTGNTGSRRSSGYNSILESSHNNCRKSTLERPRPRAAPRELAASSSAARNQRCRSSSGHDQRLQPRPCVEPCGQSRVQNGPERSFASAADLGTWKCSGVPGSRVLGFRLYENAVRRGLRPYALCLCCNEQN